MGRFFGVLKPNHVSGYPIVQPQEQFENEIAKETDRSNRRGTNREFALIMLDFSDRQANDKKIVHLASDFAGRLRISDTIGWFDFRLSVLLPETGKEGAMAVANDLMKIATRHGIDIQTSISVYPWDDGLVAITEQVRQGNDYMGGGSNYHGNNHDHDHFDGSESSERMDSAHHSHGPHAIDSQSSNNGDHHRDGEPTASLSFDITDQYGSDAAVATLARPTVKKTIALPGTGNKMMFRSERTPVWKRSIDIVGAGVGIMLLSPVFVTAAIAIKLSAPGPVFFRQKREGKDGKPFDILKFRTMVVDAEAKQAELRSISEQDGPAFKLTNDPRVTKVGRYLRKSCIDELPQLFNVLMGQMSLVGPRPLPVGESEQCEAWQRQRLTVLPGCTCIWQAHGGRDIPFAEWMRMDMEYIRKRSFFYDLKLIFETAYLALLHRGSV